MRMIVLALLVTAIIVLPASAKLHSGQVSMFPGDGYDFSDSLTTGSTLDFLFIVVAREKSTGAFSELFLAVAPASIWYAGNADTTYSSLVAAPTNPDVYGSSESVLPGDVFVVHTREGHYAKMRITNMGSLIDFEYTYQDDGSPSFQDTTPTRMVTWGEIKALYR